ncbi:hypothetical protein [Mycobacterium lepromatosis]|uniref:hypothetical protein n=1 Tax=Mycobacterium lepromatosis TaxID=480418 RepID=UPI000ADADBB8|nr:hypothetical protein [Mycobacterium lepromatosis]
MATTSFEILVALVLDVHALVLHLFDVYWSEDERTLVDVFFTAAAVGLLILGLHLLMFFCRCSIPTTPWCCGPKWAACWLCCWLWCYC